MKWIDKNKFYIITSICIVLTILVGIIRRPYPDMISDTTVRIVQSVLLVIAIICYLIQANRNTNKERSNNNGT